MSGNTQTLLAGEVLAFPPPPEKPLRAKPLRILIVEDCARDAELAIHELKSGGLNITWEKVETGPEMEMALKKSSWDLVLSDYRLPQFSGLDAWRLLQASKQGCPFIMLSDLIEENLAVEVMKQGAHCLLKSQLTRLVPTVQHVLADAETRRQRRLLEEKLQHERKRTRALVVKSTEAVFVLDAHGRITYASPPSEHLLGLPPEQYRDRLLTDFVHADDAAILNAGLATLLRKTGSTWERELRLRRRGKRPLWAGVYATNLLADQQLRGIVVNCRDVTPRKRAEQQARESRQHMQAILDHSPALIYLKDLAGRYILTNRPFVHKFGHGRKHVVGLTVSDLQPAELAELRLAHDLEVMIRDVPVTREETSNEPDGTHIYLAVKFPLHDADGRLCGIGGIGTDITEHKRIEAELRRRNRELFLINRVIAATNAESDATAVLQIACRELAMAFELPHVAIALRNEAQTHATITAEYHSTDHPSMLGETIPLTDSAVSRHLTNEKSNLVSEDAPGDQRLVSVRPLIQRARVVSLGIWPLVVERQTVGSLLMATDHRRSFAEDAALVANVAVEISGALARSRLNEISRRLLTAIEQSPESVVITDPTTHILYVNPAFERVTGYTRAEALGQSLRLMESDQHDAAFHQTRWADLAAGRVWRGRLKSRRKDHSLFTEDAIIAPVHDTAGTITHYVATKRDISRELQLEEQFYHAQRMEAVGQLAGGVAHDFNNILAVILMHVNLLQLTPDLSPKIQASLAELAGATQRGVGITRQLLMFSRRQMLQPQIFDLNHALAGLVKMLRRLLGENYSLELEVGDPQLWLQGDVGMIEQVVMNLCVNARDAMESGGRVLLSTARIDVAAGSTREGAAPGTYVRLAVTDTGCGMDETTLRRIFEPFFTTKPVGKGTGLGLATVYSIVRQHGGWVEVDSTVGRGTVFRVFLPFINQAPAATAEVPAGLPGGREHILLVEDDDAVRKAVSLSLQRCGYRVTEADNGLTALHIWEEQNHEFDLLLTDVTMPGGISGLQLAEQMQRAKGTLGIVIMSGYNSGGLSHGRTPPGSVFLHKPVDLPKLLHTVREVIRAGPPASPADSGEQLVFRAME